MMKSSPRIEERIVKVRLLFFNLIFLIFFVLILPLSPSLLGVWFGNSFIETTNVADVSTYANRRVQRLRSWLSYVFVILMVGLVAALALTMLALQIFVERSIPKFGKPVGAILMAVFMGLSEELSKFLAVKLTNFENHRVTSTYESGLAFKAFLFNFFLKNSALYFVAFVKGRLLFDYFLWLKQFEFLNRFNFVAICNEVGNCCKEENCPRELEMLVLQLVATKAVANLVKSYFLPLVLGLVLRGKELKSLQTKDLKPFQLECTKAPFKGTLMLYHHIIEQFTFLVLFASALPLGPIIALITNAIWLRNQASTLLKFYMRPRYQEQSRGPVQWVTALNMLIFLSIGTNIGLIIYTFHVQIPNVPRLESAFLIEHLVMLIWLGLVFYIPAIPGNVRTLLARSRYALQYGKAKMKKMQ
jgi:hypothetical protein